jgi:hypothetical protein
VVVVVALALDDDGATGASDPAARPPIAPRPLPPPPGASRLPWPMVRAVALVVYAAVLVWAIDQRGIPFEREAVVLWVCGGLLLVNLGRPWSQALRLVVDWLPLVAVMMVYDLVRGLGDEVGRAHFRPQLEADRAVFGGRVPTVWLQERLYDGGGPRAWEVVPALLYASHFVVPLLVAGVLWQRDRGRWLAFVRRFVTVSFLAAAVFALFPTAPPWLAAREGLIGPVHRTSVRGWSLLHLDVAGRLLDRGQRWSNLVAAVPSLHAGYAFLVALTVWGRARPWLRAVVATYAVAMGAALVATGEHYVVDVVAGWAAVGLTCLGWRWWERRANR